MTDAFARALAVLRDFSGDGSGLADPLVAALPIDGAAVATLGPLLASETIAASDPTVARLDELQFDLREGPCWDALRTARPVLEPDLRHNPRHSWPAFSEAALREDVGAIFAFPMIVGRLKIGAVDLYSARAREFTRDQSEQAGALVAVVGRQVLRRSLDALVADAGEAPRTDRFSRRIVHQATGMVIAQLGVSPGEAELVLRGHAFAESRSMREVAEDVLAGRLGFRFDNAGIEDHA
ncbi:GAF and ANTAR domain-containing protein [Herbiconiux sp.]|uniref:GAF and ANTAR domain-containing protein n=1 Tax=Herbiconiux sp. TaxID=1871186 RepID=UPI0025BF75E5|nr:GAF and ANTAR domain-containing protein [Herbiconiux sp.]